MPSNDLAQFIRPAADARNAKLVSAKVTLGAANAVTVMDAPNWAAGFRLYPSAEIRFAINEDPATDAAAAASGTPLTLTDLEVGGVAKASLWEKRFLESGTARTLRLRAIAGAEVVVVEFF